MHAGFRAFSRCFVRGKMTQVLNVAEKPSIAKTIAGILSNNNSNRANGLSKYNPLYRFNCAFAVEGLFPQQNFNMVMTSVSGHLKGFDFGANHRNWQSCSPQALFDAPIQQTVLETNKQIARTLERESAGKQLLIIWTDCDREGEAIGQEIADTCRSKAPNIIVKRARFSVANGAEIWNAVRNLVDINQREVDAVNARAEIDLRIGAAFTRLQTLRLRERFAQLDQTMSFGPCQFPTLGFVVDRYDDIQSFVPEEFWKIDMSWQSEDGNEKCDFLWERQRLYDRLACATLYEMCVEAGTGVITSVLQKPKSKWRPLPLSTVELQVACSKYLRISSQDTMAAAERLYQKGLISYPRTETDSFAASFDLRSFVNLQRQSPQWGQYAGMLLDENGFREPRQGRKNDEAHPPIHPTQYVAQFENDNQKRVYEYVVRHYLACCSQDAKGSETTVSVELGGEQFLARGLQVLERNFLDVYPYTRWGGGNILPAFNQGDIFHPSSLEMKSGVTTPPELLTEVDLIRLMDRHGIGTDATIQDHIKTILTREYAVKKQWKV
mmetsp:Transcript_25789/g.41706  ORF Transcript_25789/g.41706 Transcript_25789/m.41706 type:complete len:552 (+) Transcript_25789:85-1740(+)